MTGCEGVLIVSYRGHRAALPRVHTITEPCITSQLWTPGERASSRKSERERDKNRHIHLIVFPSLAAVFLFFSVDISPPARGSGGQSAPAVLSLYKYFTLFHLEVKEDGNNM